jgi:predicted dienelactone hydrolase
MKAKYLLLTIALLPFMAFGQMHIGEQTFKYNDTLRKRPLKTEIWYPTTDSKAPTFKEGFPFIVEPTVRNGKLPEQKYPLVMISHGTGGGRLTLEWLADTLVKQGFIVAAVDHWGNTYDNKIPIDFVTPWQRAQDISFVLTQLLKEPSLSNAIDTRRIGAAGFSIGGYTVIALAGAKLNLAALEKFTTSAEGKAEIDVPEFPGLAETIDEKQVKASFAKSPPLKDKRIKAVFTICPAIGLAGHPDRSQFRNVDIPVYIVGAESDRMTPIKTNALHYHKMLPKSKLYIVPGKTGHYVFLNEANADLKKTGAETFNDDPSVNRKAVHQQVGGMAVQFFKQYLR